MGQALYRKHRSKNLDEVVGQDHITSTLKNALKTGKISHAYLFTGPRGVGKTSVARILAHEVNGFDYDDKSYHLDIIEIDAASNRRIDEIRDLRDKVHIAPTVGKYKVYIIDEVHMLTKEAFNALLKTLEEPPEHVIFILATTESHKLPQTIVSRTQRFSFKPIDTAKAVEHLKSIAKAENIKIDSSALELIAKHGEGSFRDSISLLDQISNTDSNITLETVQQTIGIAPEAAVGGLIDCLTDGTPAELIEQLSKLHAQGYSSINLAKQIGEVVRAGLISGGSVLDNKQTTELLGKLLSVPAAINPDRALELYLLEVTLNNGASQSATATDLKEVKQTGKTKKAEEPKLQQVQPKAVASSKSTFSPEDWNSILKAIKTKHNTLYSILRMAESDYDNSKLTLKFKFAFHQKRINESRNRKIIDDFISQYSSSPVELIALVDPGAKESTPSKINSESSVKNISNIFGGAEVLDS